jgi:hypothetical protein
MSRRARVILAALRSEILATTRGVLLRLRGATQVLPAGGLPPGRMNSGSLV